MKQQSINLNLPEGWITQQIKESQIRALIKQRNMTLAFVEIENNVSGTEYTVTCHAKMLSQVERKAYKSSLQEAIDIAQDYIHEVNTACSIAFGGKVS